MHLSMFSFRCTNYSEDFRWSLLYKYFLWDRARQKFYKTSHLILQIHCCMHSRSHLCGSDSLPWLECPCRDSYTLGTWDHTDTSSHCPCRWTPLLNYRQYSSELPGQNVLADTQAVWPEDLKEREYYVINAKGCSRQASFPTYVTNYEKENYMAFGDNLHVCLAFALCHLFSCFRIKFRYIPCLSFSVWNIHSTN